MFLVQIVGNSFRPPEAKERFAAITEGESLKLRRDPENPYDENAVEVHTEDDVFVGFIPKKDNRSLAKQLDEGKEFTCTAARAPGEVKTCNIMITDVE